MTVSLRYYSSVDVLVGFANVVLLTDTARGRVYVTIRCPSVCLSVCRPIVRPLHAATVGPAGRRYRLIAAWPAARRIAAAAPQRPDSGSATFSADVGR